MKKGFPFKNEQEQENSDRSYDYDFNDQQYNNNYNNLDNSFGYHFDNYYGGGNNYFSSHNFGFESHNHFDNNYLFNNNLEDMMNSPNQIKFDVNVETEPLEPAKKENKGDIIPIEARNTSQASIQKSEVNNNHNNNNYNNGNNANDNNINSNIIILLPKKEKKNLYKIKGRKKKGDKSEREHNKFSKDDQMRKIKVKVTQFLPNYVNTVLSIGYKKFLKVDKKVNENLERAYNIDLMNMTLKEIFTNNSISGKYSKSKYKQNYNAKLVEEIYSKGEEKKAMERLNQTYIDVLDIIRKNYLSEFKEEILRKEIKNGENKETAKIYVDDIGKLFLNYENWFYDKIPKI